MIRSQIRTLAMAAAVATAGLAAIACGASGQPAGTTPPATIRASSLAGVQLSYSYYRSMMGRHFGGSMMGGGSRGWMMSPAGYRWMTGITGGPRRSSWMPMMTSRPAFTGSALWFLGNPTTAGMHTGTLTFTAAAPGTYHYLCPVPGHAQKGMTGLFTVSNTS